jgi:hypothetical protein
LQLLFVYGRWTLFRPGTGQFFKVPHKRHFRAKPFRAGFRRAREDPEVTRRDIDLTGDAAKFGVGDVKDLIRDKDLAPRLGYKNPRTLRRMFSRGRGPAAIRIGKFLFYRAQSVARWIAAQERQPGTGRGRRAS